MTSKPKTMTEELRKSVADSGLSLYRIAKDSGVPHAAMHRFVNDGRDLKLSTADKLAAYFGLRLVGKESTKRKGGK